MSTDKPLKRILEALIFQSGEAISLETLVLRTGCDTGAVREQLEVLRSEYQNRGVELVEVAGGYVLRTALDLAPHLQEYRERKRKLSPSTMECLAIIAYRQPVTRAEIEEIRGVTMHRSILDTLLMRGWIKPLGRRDSPGQPMNWGTTDGFLAHFDLQTLEDLPRLDDLKDGNFPDEPPESQGEELS